MKLRPLALTLLLVSTLCFAEHDRVWLEAGYGIDGGSVRFKMRDQSLGWSVSLNRFDDGFRNLFDSYEDRESTQLVHPQFTTIGVSRFVSSSFGWGYADIGIGAALGKGQWVENCTSERQGFFGSRHQCDYKEGSVFGIPIQGTAVLGRHAGIGVYFDALYPLDQDPQFQFGIIIPLGHFTK